MMSLKNQEKITKLDDYSNSKVVTKAVIQITGFNPTTTPTPLKNPVFILLKHTTTCFHSHWAYFQSFS